MDKINSVGKSFSASFKKSFSSQKVSSLDEDFVMSPEVIDMTKEYGLLVYYNKYNNQNKMNSLYSFMNSSLENGQWTFLDLNQVQKNINEHFQYLSLRKRYSELLIESKNILVYDHEGFHINEHTFETLDEVQRALNQKMFL